MSVNGFRIDFTAIKIVVAVVYKK